MTQKPSTIGGVWRFVWSCSAAPLAWSLALSAIGLAVAVVTAPRPQLTALGDLAMHTAFYSLCPLGPILVIVNLVRRLPELPSSLAHDGRRSGKAPQVSAGDAP